MTHISLAAEQRRGRLSFRLFPSLPLWQRLGFFLLVVSVGISIMFRINTWLGLPVYLFGLMLGAARGVSNKRKGADTDNDRWVMAAGKDLRKIRRKMNQAKELPANPLSSASGYGCLVLILCIGAVAALDLLIIPGRIFEAHLAPIVTAQAGLLLFVFFSGTAGPWAPPDIDKKIDLFEKVRDHVLGKWEGAKPVVAPMLKIDDGAKESKPTPEDLKLLISFSEGPKDFIGIQVQITFNRQMPYLYCVVLAKDTFGPLKAYNGTGPTDMFFEKGKDKDVVFLVVRKPTSKTEYSTNEKEALHVVDAAMETAVRLIGKAY